MEVSYRELGTDFMYPNEIAMGETRIWVRRQKARFFSSQNPKLLKRQASSQARYLVLVPRFLLFMTCGMRREHATLKLFL